MSQTVYFVGSQSEVAHHAAPLRNRRNLRIADSVEVLRTAKRGDLAVFYSEHFDRFRDCVMQLKQRQVATLYMIDGILEWRNAWENRIDEPACPWAMRPALAHKVACIGHSQITMLNAWGNSNKTELVGIPRLDRLRNCTPSPLNNSMQPFRILLMSAKCPGFTKEQTANTVQGFKDLKNWLTDNPTIENRPVEIQWRLTGDLANILEVKNSCQDLTGYELVEAIQNVDAVITTPSTAMLEAMLLKRPVAILDYNHSPHLVPAAWTISTKSQITKTVQELAERPAAKLDYQQTILNTALLPTAHASQRLHELVDRMLQAAGEVSEGEELNFPANLLDNLDVPIELGFDHRALYPTFDEFKNENLVEMQCQLAHSRREIEHLQNEKAQLKSELTQAHEIFEQIHNHPVAGPIVRLRQKLIDWMGRNRIRAEKNLSDIAELPTTPKEPTATS